MCDQKHGGFWPNLRHFDVTIDLFLWRIPLTLNTNVKKTEIHTPRSICLKQKEPNLKFPCEIFKYFSNMPAFCSVPGCQKSPGTKDVSSHG